MKRSLKIFRHFVFYVLLGLLPNSALCDEVAILQTPQDRAQARIDSLRSADEIFEVVYLMNEDSVGLEKLSLLRKKAKTGATVKLLVDAHGNSLSQNMIQYLTTSPDLGGRFEIKLFNALNPNIILLNRYRMHSKLQITTDKETKSTVAIGGGTNLQDEYYGRGPKPFMDTDLYLKGRAADQSKEYFLKLWNSHLSKPSTGLDNVFDYLKWIKDMGRSFLLKPGKRLSSPKGILASKELLDQAYKNLTTNKVIDLKEPGRWHAHIKDVGNVAFHHDDLETFQGSHKGVLELLEKATTSIKIENPYVIFSPDFRSVLKRAVDRGVSVEIITSWKHSDSTLVRAGIKLESRWMNAIGVKLYEFEPKYFLHKKTIVVDDRWVGLGSYNLDPRSQYLNHEVFFTFENPDVAVAMAKRFQQERSHSTLITRPSQMRFRMGCEYVLQSVATLIRNDL